jgi:2-polyprenyl-3-methyl-5-hydroxy-6-metoxy-1,4-benzoquinol methylase
MNVEYERLESIAADSRYSAGVNEQMVRHSYGVAKRWIRGPRVLELGPAEGHMTDALVADGFELTVVEGSRRFCDEISLRHPSVTVVQSIFEDFDSAPVFDTVVLGHVLEHVEDPVQVLRRVHGWLAPGGRVFAAVPNARSIHRQAAVIMGLLEREDALNEIDRHHGHRRVYDPESFRAVFAPAGLSIEFFGGYWLKPLSNGQIEAHWTPEMLDAFVQLGERYPDIAAEIYVVAGQR